MTASRSRALFVRLLAGSVLAIAAPAIAQTTNNAPGAAAARTEGPTARPWMNTALSADARVDLLLKEMTRDETLQLTFG